MTKSSLKDESNVPSTYKKVILLWSSFFYYGIFYQLCTTNYYGRRNCFCFMSFFNMQSSVSKMSMSILCNINFLDIRKPSSLIWICSIISFIGPLIGLLISNIVNTVIFKSSKIII